MVNRLHLQKAKHRRARRGAGCRTKILEAVRQALANGLPMVNMNGRRRLALYNNLVRGSELRGSGEKTTSAPWPQGCRRGCRTLEMGWQSGPQRYMAAQMRSRCGPCLWPKSSGMSALAEAAPARGAAG
mmetsp:Transcript_65531/g.213366  ORF Transcript_65531/g.213366 Transcript_65531/m.213366 type:complete len:129 (-) Transcript_65531:337-723(-)